MTGGRAKLECARLRVRRSGEGRRAPHATTSRSLTLVLARARAPQHEEMRKSLWKPRFTPVTFSLLLTATAELGPDAPERLRYLPRVLKQMGSYGVNPRVETCERLLKACLKHDELEGAGAVMRIAQRARHTLTPSIVARYERRVSLAANG